MYQLQAEQRIINDVTGQDLFRRATQVKIPKTFDKPWGAYALSPTISWPIAKGHILLVSLWMRAVIHQGGESGTIVASLERLNPWDGIGNTRATLDANWRQVVIVAKTEKPYRVNTVAISLHLISLLTLRCAAR